MFRLWRAATSETIGDLNMAWLPAGIQAFTAPCNPSHTIKTHSDREAFSHTAARRGDGRVLTR